ncbi:MAG: hypothetical protein Kow0074_03230 [Candidatus Zixiibacteriota bacterium]
MRIVYDADSCPIRASVYLDETTDTISGFELVLLWNRPDVLRFETTKSSLERLNSDDRTAEPDTVSVPGLMADSGLVDQWAFVEARGDKGHMAKVIGLAQLVDPNPGVLIKPGDQGLLFELPLNVVADAMVADDADSLTLEIQPQVSRVSNAQGTLISRLQLHPVRVAVPVCR